MHRKSYFCLFEFIVLYKLGSGFGVFCSVDIYPAYCSELPGSAVLCPTFIWRHSRHCFVFLLFLSLFFCSFLSSSSVPMIPWLGCYTFCSCSAVLGYSVLSFSSLCFLRSLLIQSLAQRLFLQLCLVYYKPRGTLYFCYFFFFNL